MSNCSCGGNNSLRSAIGGIRCECGGMLTTAQTLHRIISRLNELDEEYFETVSALQRLGLDKCDQCGEWKKDCWTLLDRCRCPECLEGNPEGPVYCCEEDDEETVAKLEDSVVRFLASRGQPIRSKMLIEAKRRVSI